MGLSTQAPKQLPHNQHKQSAPTAPDRPSAGRCCGRYDQRHRVAEQCDPQGDQETKTVSNGRFRHESYLPGNIGRIQTMDHADPKLETRVESIYDRI